MSGSLNNYDALALHYAKTNSKPDKLYCMRPMILNLAKPLTGKILLDIGCGNGFYSIPLAKDAKKVYAIDNSLTQLTLAEQKDNIEYQCKDMFDSKLPLVDIINAPYVLNYCKHNSELELLLKNFYSALNPGGKALFIVDMPLPFRWNPEQRKKWGAIKKPLGTLVNNAPLTIELYNQEYLCTLHSIYFTKECLTSTLETIGYTHIIWHTPVVSKEGIEKFGKQFWDRFEDFCELGFCTAEKN